MDPRWNEVARLQAIAWRVLAEQNPKYETQDVEKTAQWQEARALADKIMEENNGS
jgi:hypothetical protein